MDPSAGAGWHAPCPKEVLQRDGHTVQGTERFTLGAALIEGRGAAQRVFAQHPNVGFEAWL